MILVTVFVKDMIDFPACVHKYVCVCVCVCVCRALSLYRKTTRQAPSSESSLIGLQLKHYDSHCKNDTTEQNPVS